MEQPPPQPPPRPQSIDYANGWSAAPATRTMHLPARSGGERAPREVLQFLAWRIGTALVVGGVVVLVGWAIAPALGAMTMLAFLVLLPAAAGMMRQVRFRRAMVVLGYLEQAVRLNLPLPRLLHAAALSESGPIARRLVRLRDLVADGAPLELALPAAVPEMPSRVVGLVSAGERLGQLGPTLYRLAAEQRDGGDSGLPRDEDASRGSFARWYPLAVGSILLVVVTIILVFVMPKFEEIFKDFGFRLPPPTVALLKVARLANEAGFLLIVVPGALVVAMGGAARAIFDPDADGYRPAWVDYLAWYLPVTGGLARDRGLADACQTVADALRTGRPLPRAVDEAAGLPVNAVLRRRLGRWRDAIERGRPADRAARDAGLPELVAGFVGPGKGNSLPQALEFVSAYYAARFSRARELLRAAIVPGMVLLFAAMVLFVASAAYRPLIDMMDFLNDNVLNM